MIKIYRNGLELGFKQFVFSGGEVSIKLNTTPRFFQNIGNITLLARVQNSDDLVSLGMIKDAIMNEFRQFYSDLQPPPIDVVIPYFPGARQDRCCDRGESFSAKVYANLINSLEFNTVTVIDPHSGVTPALINNVRVISQLDVINKDQEFIKRVMSGNNVFIAPDAGSNKKVSEIAKFFNREGFARADKLRDLTNGNIKETIVYCEDFQGQDVICPDDILDGGKSFTELAKVCKAKNCGKFILYIAHSIFSKGASCLFANGIDEIWTTTSFLPNPINNDDSRVNWFRIEKMFNL